MQSKFIDIQSIDEVHRFYNCDKPKHPLISIIDLSKTSPNRPRDGALYRTHLYTIMCKRFDGTMKYGRGYYDFNEGSVYGAATSGGC